MLSKIPLDEKKDDIDKQILRTGMIAELDAVSLYEQMAAAAKSDKVRKLLLDIAKEEKTHVGEFETMLFEKDKEQEKETEKAVQEVKEKFG